MPETQKQPRWGPLGSAPSNTSLLGGVSKPVAEMVEVSGRLVCLFSLSSAHACLCVLSLETLCMLNPTVGCEDHIVREKVLRRGLGFALGRPDYTKIVTSGAAVSRVI